MGIFSSSKVPQNNTSGQEILLSRRIAPSWEEVVETIIATIAEAERIYYESNKNYKIQFHFTLDNFFVIIGKVSDVYTFISFCFQSAVPWFGREYSNSDINITAGSGPIYEQWKFFFFISLGLTLIYLLLCIPGLKHAKQQTLGINQATGQKAKFPHNQFFLNKSLNVLGGSLWMLIMKSYFDSFICDFSNTDETTETWQLYRDQDIRDTHAMYMVLGFIGLLCYYPISTFFYPNFQFQDKVLDLKYNPSFLIFLIQFKLLISGIDSFFKSFSGTTFPVFLQLSIELGSMIFLGFCSLKFKPCLIRKFNLIDAASYFSIAALCIASLVVIIDENNSLIAILSATGAIIIIIILTIILWRKQESPKVSHLAISDEDVLRLSKLSLRNSEKLDNYSNKQQLNTEQQHIVQEELKTDLQTQQK